MKLRAFNKVLNSCRTPARRGKPRTLDLGKIRSLADDVKADMVAFLARQRGPILVDLVPAGTDLSHLAALGYLYRTTGAETGLTFLHLGEHQIR